MNDYGKSLKTKKPEILAPASNLDVLETAIRYGADAVYIGGHAFGLRASANNFSISQMKEGVAFAHKHGAKVYVTVNIFAHNDDLKRVEEYFEELKAVMPDGLIISDPAIFMIAKKMLPSTEIHISTQSNNTNYGTFNFWHDFGAKRAVTARELSISEIASIKENIPKDMEIETFVHGAMCMSYSGRCLLSNFMTGRDANKGACTHPCRWKYYLMEEKRPGEYMPIEETKNGTYIFNSRDLCMVDHIPELVSAGIDSFKIEGRMKNALYVAAVTRAYRMAVDDYFEDEEKYFQREKEYLDMVSQCTYRQYTTGFFFGKPGNDAQIYSENTYKRNCIYLGIAEKLRDDGSFFLKQKNKFCVGDKIEIMKPDGSDVQSKVISIKNMEGKEMDSCPHAGEMLWVTLDNLPDAGDVLFMREGEN